MEPTHPRTYDLSGVAPTVRARSALVRAMSALNKWEAHYLAGRGAERVLAYQELMRAVSQAEQAMAEATGRIGYGEQRDIAGDGTEPSPGEPVRLVLGENVELTESEQRVLDGNR